MCIRDRASTMYDMSRCTANGYFDENDNADARYEMRRQLSSQRTIDAKNGSYATAGGVVDPCLLYTSRCV